MDLQGWALVITAMATLISAFLSGVAAIYAAKAKIHSVAASEALVVVQADVHKVEVATNSLTERLVKATGDASFAAGKDQGKADEKAKQARRDGP